MLSLLVKLYGPFFNIHNWENVFKSSSDWMIILSLVIIECLLSVDNAIVLAAQTKKLSNEKDQKRSLFYGLWGAYIFRFLLIGIGVFLIKFWWIKIIGSFYLMYLSIAHFYKLDNGSNKNSIISVKKNIFSSFWSVVISIEFMDIIFSIDSILASLAISSNPVLVLIGGMIGILCMRGIAELISNFMKKIPELEIMAYILIFIIAIKLFLSIPSINIEIPAGFFGIIIFIFFIITIIIHKIRNR